MSKRILQPSLWALVASLIFIGSNNKCIGETTASHVANSGASCFFDQGDEIDSGGGFVNDPPGYYVAWRYIEDSFSLSPNGWQTNFYMVLMDGSDNPYGDADEIEEEWESVDTNVAAGPGDVTWFHGQNGGDLNQGALIGARFRDCDWYTWDDGGSWWNLSEDYSYAWAGDQQWWFDNLYDMNIDGVTVNWDTAADRDGICIGP